jgi:hypothetical protein
MSALFMVPKCLVKTVLINHVLLIVMCENENVDISQRMARFIGWREK